MTHAMETPESPTPDHSMGYGTTPKWPHGRSGRKTVRDIDSDAHQPETAMQYEPRETLPKCSQGNIAPSRGIQIPVKQPSQVPIRPGPSPPSGNPTGRPNNSERRRHVQAALPPTSSGSNNYETWDPSFKRPRSMKKQNMLPPTMKAFPPQISAERKTEAPPPPASTTMYSLAGEHDPQRISDEEEELPRNAKEPTGNTNDITDTGMKDPEPPTDASPPQEGKKAHTPEADPCGDAKEPKGHPKESIQIDSEPEVQYVQMQEKDWDWLSGLIAGLPDQYRDIFLNTPELRYVPISLFEFSMKEGAYPPSQRAFAKMLTDNNREIIPLLVRLDLEAMRSI